jgi:hypothetical protein
MPSITNNLLAEARAALISDPARAAVLLEEVGERLRAPSETDREPLNGAELTAIAKLARNGEQLWRAWGRLLGLEPGYTSDGVLAAEPHASHIAVEG